MAAWRRVLGALTVRPNLGNIALEESSRQGPGRDKDQGGPSRFPHINRFFCMGDFATYFSGGLSCKLYGFFRHFPFIT